MTRDDELTRQLLNLKSDLPEPRRNLTEAEKDELIRRAGGPLTTQAIIKAQQQVKPSRIPFLFSSIDAVVVMEILANDMDAAIQRAQKQKK